MELAAGAGSSDRQEGCSAPQNAADAAAPCETRAELERFMQSLGLEGGAHDANDSRIVDEQMTAPPDEPGAMTEQALESWSLSELVGVPRLGRLLSAVQR